MTEELTKMGAQVEELPDSLVIKGGALRGTRVEGHDDHRVVMSLAVAGMAAEGATTVGTAEAVSVTFPTFPALMSRLGAAIRVVE
jgi:3-phosphoshikimate 1-carboxyvinyltransferase